MRALAALAMVLACASAQAQRLEPGEWDFTTTVSAPGLPRPTQTGMRTCITREQSKDPVQWGANPQQPADCRATTLKLGPDTVSWEMECPSSGMHGAGKVRLGKGSLESEVQLGSAAGGVDLRMKTSGRRLGPCKP